VSLDRHIEVVCLPVVEPGKATQDELNLISSMLPELMLLVQQLDESDED